MNFPDIKYDGLHIPNLLSLEDEKRFSDLINCNIFDLLFVSKRIGSESQVGTVWLSSLNTQDFQVSFVIKVQSNRNKARSEFDVQYYLSHKWPNNFIISYNSIDCPEVTLWYRGHPTIVKTGNFIFMETAVGDLSQVIRFGVVSENMLTYYILNVIESVKIISSEGIFHGDLHIRQIFIVLRSFTHCDTVYKAVIGDFGEHLRIESPSMHLTDLKTFFKSLLEIIDYIEKSENFILKIEKCLQFINNQITKIELNDMSYNVESIENDISEIEKFFIL